MRVCQFRHERNSLLKTPCWRLTMAIWADRSDIRSGIVAIVTVNMVELKCQRISVPLLRY